MVVVTVRVAQQPCQHRYRHGFHRLANACALDIQTSTNPEMEKGKKVREEKEKGWETNQDTRRERAGGGRGTRDRGARDTSNAASGRLLHRHWRGGNAESDEGRGSTIRQKRKKVARSAAHVAHAHRVHRIALPLNQSLTFTQP